MLLSHACGTGPNLSKEIVRSAILIRANSFASSKSGVSLELVQILLDLLNNDLTQVIQKKNKQIYHLSKQWNFSKGHANK